MGLFRTRRGERFEAQVDGVQSIALRQEALDRFGLGVLDLGDLSTPSKAVEAICAIFDLGGFTDFCRQVDPHLAVPVFMRTFLDWLFNQLKVESIRSKVEGGAAVWTEMPFFAKFMGDGALILWNSDEMASEMGIANVAVGMNNICSHYTETFLPAIRKLVVRPPAVLRCGVARGRVYSVGRGRDFVGPCINIAARLQKLAPDLTFAFSTRGFDMSQHPARDYYVIKKVAIRGIGEEELVYVDKQEFAKLPKAQRSLFAAP
jgi:class 3 adenylate cyclase